MRLVYTADLHGDFESYRSLLDLATATGARAAIVGGDLLPHAIKRATALRVQREFIKRSLRPLLETFRAAHPAIGVYLLVGNDDWAAAAAALDELEVAGLAHLLHERVYALALQPSTRPESAEGAASNGSQPADGHDRRLWLAGYACVPLTPFSIKDYERRDEGPLPAFSFGMAYASWGGEIHEIGASEIESLPSIAEGLAALARQSDPARTIYVCHTPPANTPLDQMPHGKHVGSRAVRSFIAQYAPPLTLHGHIHEAPRLSGRYAIQLGTTWCVNPGQEPPYFHAVSLDTDDVAGTITHTVFGRP
jgi:Icc-related predicted phosphoesterase